MDSRTKAVVSQEQLVQMLDVAGIKDFEKIEELKGGEFNLAYRVYTKNGDYIVKIGPNENTTVMYYEKGIMEIELWAYEEIRKNTDILIPEIIYSSHEVIGNHWFIMSVIPEKLLYQADLTEEQMYNWQFQFGQALAKLHRIKNDKYGYQQVKLHDTWKDAYYDMIFNLIADAEKQGCNLPDLSRILRFIRKWEGALDEVSEPRLVHFDLFNNNVFIDKNGNFAGMIDMERCFFGDLYVDLFAVDIMNNIEDNKGLIDGYNSISEEKIVLTPNTRARVALGKLMLGLIMFTEGTTRLALDKPEHWERKYHGAMIIDLAIKEMEPWS